MCFLRSTAQEAAVERAAAACCLSLECSGAYAVLGSETSVSSVSVFAVCCNARCSIM